MTCGLCGRDFEEDRSQPACRACPVGDGCGLVRCPWCSYENPTWPRWLKAVGRWLGRLEGRKAPPDVPASPTPPGEPERAAAEPGLPLPILRPPAKGSGARRDVLSREEDAA